MPTKTQKLTLLATKNITIERARVILGTTATNLTDKHIEVILESLYRLSNRLIGDQIS